MDRSTSDRFAVAIACIDGRTHEPLTDWTRAHADIDWVDLITEPGADAALAGCPQSGCSHIRDRVRVSLTAHRPRLVVIAGHDDCAANPVAADVHRAQIRAAVDEVRSWNLDVPTIGIWILADGQVEPVTGEHDRGSERVGGPPAPTCDQRSLR